MYEVACSTVLYDQAFRTTPYGEVPYPVYMGCYDMA